MTLRFLRFEHELHIKLLEEMGEIMLDKAEDLSQEDSYIILRKIRLNHSTE